MKVTEARAAALARRLDLPVTTTWRWLVGHSRPSRLSLRLLAQAGVVLELPPFIGRPAPRRRLKGRR